jgi:cupin 2 domain-containing protein
MKDVTTGNLFANVSLARGAELIEALAESSGVRIERIVSREHSSPEHFWYEDPRNEWVLLVSGSAELRFEGSGTFKLSPGDWILIPAGRRHRVETTSATEDTIWIAVYYDV